mmetsp:Transcript_17700/g.46684  ORF Transcript_17700/g.46684 Transcript_17700/m.46684 type:complete len:424 (+) Transcript_17700:44-1315(+)
MKPNPHVAGLAMRASLITGTFHIIIGGTDAVLLSSRVHREASSLLALPETLIELLPHAARPLQDIPTEVHEKRPGGGYSAGALRRIQSRHSAEESLWLLPFIALLCGGGVSSLVGVYFWSRSPVQAKIMRPEERQPNSYGSTLADLYYSLPTQFQVPRRDGAPPNLPPRRTSAESEQGFLDAADSPLFPGPPPGPRETLAAAVRRESLERGIPIEDDESMSESSMSATGDGDGAGQPPPSLGPSIRQWTSSPGPNQGDGEPAHGPFETRPWAVRPQGPAAAAPPAEPEPARSPEAARCSPAALEAEGSPHQSVSGGLPPPPSIWWTPRDPPKSWDEGGNSRSAPPRVGQPAEARSIQDGHSESGLLDAAGARAASTRSLRQLVDRGQAPAEDAAFQATSAHSLGQFVNRWESPAEEPPDRTAS